MTDTTPLVNTVPHRSQVVEDLDLFCLMREHAAEIHQAAEVLGRAFVNDPGFLWTFPDVDQRKKGSHFIKDKVLRMHVPMAATWVARDRKGGEVLGAIVWAPPGREPGMASYLRHGLLLTPFRFGLGAVRRMLRADAAMKAIQERHHTTKTHWFLDTLGVDPQAQGRRVGTTTLQTTLETVIDPSGQPSTLLTTKPENVPFYERFGYTVLDEDRVGKNDGFSLWLMRRPHPDDT
jgi:ribosomal protein S18 acetylase RimI-like enzyme